LGLVPIFRALTSPSYVGELNTPEESVPVNGST
jgi:hypothetical protein